MCLRQAREEEKQLRRSFVSNYGHHFISTLFPELMQRVPDISVSQPEDSVNLMLYIATSQLKDVCMIINCRCICHAH